MTIKEYISNIEATLWRRIGRAENETLFTMPDLSVEEEQDINTGYILGLKEVINILEDSKVFINEGE